MQTTLDVTEKELWKLRKTLAGRIASALDRAGTHYGFEPIEGAGNSITLALRCRDERYNVLARDNRGQDLFVTPIATGGGWRALLGVSTTWRRLKGQRRYFADAQIISFLEPAGAGISDVTGPIQFIRLEWEALDRNDNYKGAVAHPHWQVDIGRFAFRRMVAPPSLEVSADIPDARGNDGLPWMSKLHLAACARWMERPWQDDVYPAPHVSGPQSLDQLGDWISSACRYVHHQVNGAMGG